MKRSRARTIQWIQKSCNYTIYVITLLSEQPTSQIKFEFSRAIPVYFSSSLKPMNKTRTDDLTLAFLVVPQNKRHRNSKYQSYEISYRNMVGACAQVTVRRF